MTAARGPRVCRAVIPAAGRGTRMRTVAGGAPKELLPVGDAPMIFHAVTDLIRSGIRDIAIVVSPDKPGIRDRIGGAGESGTVPAAWRTHLAACTFHFPVQPAPRGLANAVACAATIVHDEPFVCYLPDNVFIGPRPVAAQLLHAFHTTQACTAALIRVTPDTAARFGNCGALETAALDDPLVRINRLGDKGTGAFQDAGRLGWRMCGVSVLTAEFLALNAVLPANAAGEWDDVPILQTLAGAGRFFGCRVPNACYDAGNPAGYAAAAAADLHLPPPPDASRV